MTCALIPVATPRLELMLLPTGHPGVAESGRAGSRFSCQLETVMTPRARAEHDPRILLDKTDSGNYLQSAPRLEDMLYGRIYNMFDSQSDCRGGGTPNTLCYEGAQHLANISTLTKWPGCGPAHQSIRDRHEPALDRREQAAWMRLSPNVSGWEHLRLTETTEIFDSQMVFATFCPGE